MMQPRFHLPYKVAIATGELTPADANEISKLIDTWLKEPPNWPLGYSDS